MSAVKESLSIEETNKIRISLGLKPLPVEGDSAPESKAAPAGEEDAAAPDGDELAEANYAARRAAERQEREAKEIQDRLARARNQRELKAKLKGRGLGDLAEGEADASTDLKAWIKKQKRRQKQLAADAARKEKELAEQEQPTYGEADLEGIKVGHELDEFEGGEDVILTLKDSRILEGEEDELHNVNLSEAVKAREELRVKRQGRQAGQYTGLDDDEFEAPGQKRGLLSKYNDEIDGKQEKSFRLGGAGTTSGAAMEVDGGAEGGRVARKPAAVEGLQRELISGSYSKNFERDYLQEGDVGFKKFKQKKKKKDRSTRKPAAANDESVPSPAAINGDHMDVDGDAKLAGHPDEEVLDDEEVQFAMAKMRREAGRMRNKTLKANYASEVARRQDKAARAASEGGTVKLEEDMDDSLPEPATEGVDGEEGKITSLDETSQFIRNLGLQQQEAAARAAAEAAEAAGRASAAAAVKAEDEAVHDFNGDVRMESNDSDDEEAGAIDEEAEMARLMAGDVKPEPPDETAPGTGTADETYVAGGMAATLSILKQQGLLKPLTEEERTKEQLYQEKQAWLAEKRQQDAYRQLERERAKKGGGNKDQAQREYENRQRDAQQARETMRAFEHYKPEVEIKYHDDFGRELTAKEAWKALSHKFHGKGSGRGKTEKRIKKIEEQKKMEAMASGDTPTGTTEAFRKRQEKLGEATMVLSVGNKGTAPHQEELLASLSKSTKKEKAAVPAAAAAAFGKGKAVVKSGTPSNSAPADLMMGLGAAVPASSSAPGSGAQTPMLPRKAAGFKPIAAQAVTRTASASPMPPDANGTTPRISIGLGGGTKRKAEGEVEGSPSSKRLA